MGKVYLDEATAARLESTPDRARIFFDAHKTAPAGFGLRVYPSGRRAWVLRYHVQGRARTMTLPKGFPAWGPERARREAAKLKTLFDSGVDPLGERHQKRAEEKAAEVAKAARAKHTLGGLLLAYCADLHDRGKLSADAVERALRRHVEAPWPLLWNAAAGDLTIDDALEIVARLVQSGNRREAAKVRSYLRAAYAAGIRARTDASASPELRAFGLTSNPVRDLAVPRGGTGTPHDRTLALAELRAYWRVLSKEPGTMAAILRLHLLTGGQRVEQLARATVDDWDRDTAQLTLLDSKGRRSAPRRHSLPLLPEAVAALETIGQGPFLVSLDGGANPAKAWRIGGAASEVARRMVAAGEATEPFTIGDIRRTVETRLAASGIGSDVLAHLLSHGMGGLQNRHYQRHTFAAEKLRALQTLLGLLTEPAATVTPIKRAKR